MGPFVKKIFLKVKNEQVQNLTQGNLVHAKGARASFYFVCVRIHITFIANFDWE